MKQFSALLAILGLTLGTAACGEEHAHDDHGHEEDGHEDHDHGEHENHDDGEHDDHDDGEHEGHDHSGHNHTGTRHDLGPVTLGGVTVRIDQVGALKADQKEGILEVHADEGTPEGLMTVCLFGEGATGPKAEVRFNDDGMADVHVALLPNMPENPQWRFELDGEGADIRAERE